MGLAGWAEAPSRRQARSLGSCTMQKTSVLTQTGWCQHSCQLWPEWWVADASTQHTLLGRPFRTNAASPDGSLSRLRIGRQRGRSRQEERPGRARVHATPS